MNGPFWIGEWASRLSSFFQVQMRLGAEGKVFLVPEKFFFQEICSEQFQRFFIINKGEPPSFEEELASDVLEIINVFM